MNKSQDFARVPFLEKILKEARLTSLEMQVQALEKALAQAMLKVEILEQRINQD